MRTGTSAKLLCALAALASAGVPSCGGDEATDTGPPPPPPYISAHSDSVFAPGDTITIAGGDFAGSASNNRVVFNNNLAIATPFAAQSDTLEVVVPAWANSGAMYVTSLGVRSATRKVEVTRAVGDVWVVGESASYTARARVTSAGNRYLAVPHSATATASGNYGYAVTPSNVAAYPAPPKRAAPGRKGTTSPAIEFEVDIRRQAIDYFNTHGAGKKLFERRPPAGAPATTLNFKVLNCTNCSTNSASSYTTINATLEYTGTNVLVYRDDTQPTGSFTAADYDAFGMQFDSTIFPADTTAFGPPSDIDGNGRIIILFTPVVNDLTPDGTAQTDGFISGFFLPNDLGPSIFPAGTSNNAEIFYSMVPDPNGEYGNVFNKTSISSIIPGTLAHEFEHMISFGYRMLDVGLQFVQQTWLEEGMAHIAEDLNNFDSSNIARANLYLADPGAVALTGSDTLEQRGGIYLFLRYLGDQHGDNIFRTILRSSCLGTVCVQNVSGQNFFTSLADWLATLYLSNRGITADPKYNYSSFNLQSTFGQLAVTTSSSGGIISGGVGSSSADYYIINGLAAPAVEFAVSSAASAKMRLLLVRTQ